MRAAAIALGFAIAVVQAAVADETGCEKFAWPLARERTWFATSDKSSVAVGQTLAAVPKQAFVMLLRPGSEATFALPPERKQRTGGQFGGAVWFPAPGRAGIYQVTLSEEAWIDVVQDGRYARSVGSTGRSDCPGVRKSVRLELGPTSFVLQVSGIAADAISVAVSMVE